MIFLKKTSSRVAAVVGERRIKQLRALQSDSSEVKLFEKENPPAPSIQF